ncbi:protein translocase subunit SecD [Microgenomates group bacterium]|nr:protein translocase subunit SecD [Microgenomates group bacterium]
MLKKDVKHRKTKRNCVLIGLLVLVCAFIVLPIPDEYRRITLAGKEINLNLPLKKGLDLAGGMQVTLRADMSEINEEDRTTALEAARGIIERRVDAYGLAEPSIQTSMTNDDYRILVEIPEIEDPQQALDLIGRTAELTFMLQNQEKEAEYQERYATASAEMGFEEQIMQYIEFLDTFEETPLSGRHLARASADFDPQTGQPLVSLTFNDEGQEIFGQLTSDHTGSVMGIFIDGSPVTMPVINTPILDGKAMISGAFTVDEAQDVAIQLNSGALPVRIEVLGQRTLGAKLGAESITDSLRAGMVGLAAVAIFMMVVYGKKGVVSTVGLLIYTVLILAVHQVFGITLTLAGIAGVIISIGMAVDSNILIWERMRDEEKAGKKGRQAMEEGFEKAWSSIRDANVITLLTAFVLANPGDWNFLNTSGGVRGFGITLLLGTAVALFTGIFVAHNIMRLFFYRKDHEV